MLEYAVIKTPVESKSPASGDSGCKDSKKSRAKSKKSAEMREVERELECPICMDVSQPPIYQCEEGHIICSSCKPLLKVCPHNCGKKYSEPAIRCRFAEKLADRYFATMAASDQAD